MIEKLNDLDTRINTLLESFREKNRSIETLRTENESLRDRASSSTTLSEENSALRQKVGALEEEIGSFQQRQEVIRGRLESILERFAEIEAELQAGGQEVPATPPPAADAAAPTENL